MLGVVDEICDEEQLLYMKEISSSSSSVVGKLHRKNYFIDQFLLKMLKYDFRQLLQLQTKVLLFFIVKYAFITTYFGSKVENSRLTVEQYHNINIILKPCSSCK